MSASGGCLRHNPPSPVSPVSPSAPQPVSRVSPQRRRALSPLSCPPPAGAFGTAPPTAPSARRLLLRVCDTPVRAVGEFCKQSLFRRRAHNSANEMTALRLAQNRHAKPTSGQDRAGDLQPARPTSWPLDHRCAGKQSENEGSRRSLRAVIGGRKQVDRRRVGARERKWKRSKEQTGGRFGEIE